MRYYCVVAMLDTLVVLGHELHMILRGRRKAGFSNALDKPALDQSGNIPPLIQLVRNCGPVELVEATLSCYIECVSGSRTSQ